MADDDADDRLLAKDALAECRLANELHFVENGEELLDYLNRRGKFTELEQLAAPGLILLDLNMPQEGRPRGAQGDQGRPGAAQDSRRRPDHLQGRHGHRPHLRIGRQFVHRQARHVRSLVDVMKVIGRYWFEIVELPVQEVVHPAWSTKRAAQGPPGGGRRG